MKINIDHTLQVTDEQRVQIANVLDGKITRRQATRDEMKDYIWESGKDWETTLADDFRALEEDPLPEDEADEDLLGDVLDGEDLI